MALLQSEVDTLIFRSVFKKRVTGRCVKIRERREKGKKERKKERKKNTSRGRGKNWVFFFGDGGGVVGNLF